MPNQQMLSQIVEYFSVAVQLTILVVLIVKRLGLKFPALSLMMVFFPLKSGLNFAALHYAPQMRTIPQATWQKIITGINITDNALQAAIIVELLLWLVPVLGAWRKRIWWQLALGVAVAAGFVAVSMDQLGYWQIALMRAHGIPMQQVVLANTQIGLTALTAELVLLAAFAVLSMMRTDAPDSMVIQQLATKFAMGWGIFGSANLLGLAVGRYAAMHQDVMLRVDMQYVVIGTFVLMLLLWLVSVVFYKVPKTTEVTKAA